MKKLLPLLLCLILLVSLVCVPASAAPENYCDLFSRSINLLRWWSPYNGVAPGAPFDNAIVMCYTAFCLCTDEYGDQKVTEGDYSYFVTYAIPADVFEAAAADFFNIIDVQKMRSYTSWFYDPATQTDVENFQHYQPDRNAYVFGFQGGWGDSSHYDVLGYTENATGTYTVYSRFIDIYGDERPEGVENEDYFQWGENYWVIDHYLKVDVAICNGRVQFHSWQRIDEMPDVELIKPVETFVQDEDITIEAEKDVFPEDTEVKVQTPEGATLKLVTDALETLAEKFVAYDITATHQPDGTVYVTFAIPEGYDPENLAVFYIPADGSAAYPLDIQVDAENGCVTAQLTHFSLYALVQLKQEEIPSQPTQPEATQPGATQPDATEPDATEPGNASTPDEEEQPDSKLPIVIAAVCLGLAAVVAVVLVLTRKKK